MKVLSGLSSRAWGVRYRMILIFTTVFCVFTGPAWGGNICDDASIKSPNDLMKQAGIQDPDHPCKEQNRVDKKYGNHGTCQENADGVKEKYKTWLAKHKATCEYYKTNSATLSQKCTTQDACYQQQQQVLSSVNTYLKDEKSAINALTAGIEALAQNQIDTAQGAIKIQNEIEGAAPDSKPMGVDFLRKGYQNAGQAVQYFNGQDLAEAADLIDAMAKGKQFDASSITSHAPNALTNEPLLVAQAARDFNNQMASRTADIDKLMTAYSGQQEAVAKSSSNLNTAESSTPASTNSSASADGVTSAAATAAGSLGGGAGGGSGSLSGGSGMSSGPTLGVSPANASKGGTYVSSRDALSGDGVALAGGVALPGATPQGAVAASVPDATGKDTGTHSSSGASSGLRAQLASRLAAARSAARSSASGGGAAEAAPEAASASGSKSIVARGPASIGQSIDGAGAGDGAKIGDAESLFAPVAIPAASESNEGAVKALVGAWEKSLHVDSAPAVQADLPGAEGEPLFGRVKMAYERALRRGAIVRTVSGKL